MFEPGTSRLQNRSDRWTEFFNVGGRRGHFKFKWAPVLVMFLVNV